MRQSGQASGGGRHGFFYSASLRKRNHRAVRSAKQFSRPSAPSLARPVTRIAAPPSDNGPLSDAALANPRPRPPPAGNPAGSALQNTHSANLPSPPHETPVWPNPSGSAKPALVCNAIKVPGFSKSRHNPPIRPRARRGGSRLTGYRNPFTIKCRNAEPPCKFWPFPTPNIG